MNVSALTHASDPRSSRPAHATRMPRSLRLRLPAALCALVLAVAAASVLAQPAQRGMHDQAGMHGQRHHGEPGGHGGFGAMLSARMLERVQATPEQRAQISKILEAARADLRAQRASAGNLRAQAAQVFSQPNVDAAAAEQVRQQMLAQHDRASQRMMQAMIEASRVLTPEQRLKLADELKRRRDMMERHQRERRSLDAPKS